jgi:hypothetical protein
VHEHWDPGLTDYLPQRDEVGRLEGQRIDDHILAIGGQLDQANLVKVRVHGISLSIEGEPAGANTKVHGVADAFRGLDPTGTKIVGHGWGW